jgi:hypothetical protein
MPMHPKKYPRSISVKAWGCPEAPLLHRQKSGHLSNTIFLLLHALSFFLERQLFLLLVFFCFVCCNKWLDHIIFVLEKAMLPF